MKQNVIIQIVVVVAYVVIVNMAEGSKAQSIPFQSKLRCDGLAHVTVNRMGGNPCGDTPLKGFLL